MHKRTLQAVVEHLFPGAVLNGSQRLEGGVSADVYRLDVELTVGREKQVVLRAHGASHSGHPAQLEYTLLRALHQAGLPVAEPLLVDTSGKILEDPFLIITFVEGSTAIPPGEEHHYIRNMADLLASIHATATDNLPALPARLDPLPELFEFLPSGKEWAPLELLLQRLHNEHTTDYRDTPRLLHGDFWPENVLWQDAEVGAILDWEDAALGDPLSDVAAAGLELRYLFGPSATQGFTAAYARHQAVDPLRLGLWQVYVAAAAQKYMGEWGLPAAREHHMRTEALASIREAGEQLMAAYNN